MSEAGGPGTSDQADDLVLVDLEVDRAQDDEVAEALRDAVELDEVVAQTACARSRRSRCAL
jgi:hypothetical protein